jgi:hypothetical protein
MLERVDHLLFGPARQHRRREDDIRAVGVHRTSGRFRTGCDHEIGINPVDEQGAQVPAAGRVRFDCKNAKPLGSHGCHDLRQLPRRRTGL